MAITGSCSQGLETGPVGPGWQPQLPGQEPCLGRAALQSHPADQAALLLISWPQGLPGTDVCSPDCQNGKASLMAQWQRTHLPMQKTWVRSLGGKIPWRRKWQPTPVFSPGESQGQRSLAGCSPWGRKSQTRLHFIVPSSQPGTQTGLGERSSVRILPFVSFTSFPRRR